MNLRLLLLRVKKLPERRPICRVHPVCDFHITYILYEASTVAHKTIPSPECNVMPRDGVPTNYRKILCTARTSSWVGDLVYLECMLTAYNISGRVWLARYSNDPTLD